MKIVQINFFYKIKIRLGGPRFLINLQCRRMRMLRLRLGELAVCVTVPPEEDSRNPYIYRRIKNSLSRERALALLTLKHRLALETSSKTLQHLQ